MLIVLGVRVRRNGRDIDISAPMVISDAGVSNTFRNLLPKEIAERTGKNCVRKWSTVLTLKQG